MDFDFVRALGTLKYMGIGLLGVFLIIGVIVAATYLTAHLTAPKPQEDDEKVSE